LRNVNFVKGENTKDFTLCSMRSAVIGAMKEEKEDELEEAKDLFKDGLKKIFQATKKVSEKVVEGFREGYAKDVTEKKDQ